MKRDIRWPGVAVLRASLAELDPSASAATALESLVADGLDRLPLPGSGRTLERWKALAAVAEHDLSLAKLYEGHTDALAILAEMKGTPWSDDDSAGIRTWGVWGAEAPQGRATIAPAEGHDGVAQTIGDGKARRVIVDGAKCWCSGASNASHALLTAWFRDSKQPQLIAVPIRQRGVSIRSDAWQALGMAGSASLDVVFDAADGFCVGEPGEYLKRPGFWQGGGGIAACWFGGALAIAGVLRRSMGGASPFRLAALGKVDVHLQRTAAVLREAAAWIDANPNADASIVALRARLAAENTATQVLDEVGRALGAGPFCRDARFARMAADLPVFIRQSHAERDYASLAEKLASQHDEAMSWTL